MRVRMFAGQSVRFRTFACCFAALPWLVGCGDEAVDTQGGSALLTRVRAEDYRSWRRAPGWPSRQASIAGGHGGELDIYVNERVASRLDSGESVPELPEGSVIVKDVWHALDLHAIAIMEKRSDGWYWTEVDSADGVLAAGHPGVCLDCHRRGGDYVRAFSLP